MRLQECCLPRSGCVIDDVDSVRCQRGHGTEASVGGR